MYTRVVTRQFQPGNLAAVTQLWQEKVAPILKQQKGFKGAYMTAERSTGKGMTMTLWETEADAAAMDVSGVSQQIVGLFAQFQATPPVREHYEVFVQV